MKFYHVRYTVYHPPEPPVEKEEWLALSADHNEQQLKRLLISSGEPMVSIISRSVIAEEEYQQRVAHESRGAADQDRLDAAHLKEWDEHTPDRMQSHLNDQADSDTDRYRNIDKPPPLL
jgi:hypothetical protein